MDYSPTESADNSDAIEPLWDVTPESPIAPTELSILAQNLLQVAESRKREVRCFDFVPSNYVNAWNYLAWLNLALATPDTQSPLQQTAWFKHFCSNPASRPLGFCELGSGLGVVAGLASLLGYDSFGIELDEQLSQQSKQMLREQAVPTRIVCGSYFDRLDPADIYYVYGWPSQRSKIIELFLTKAPVHALLLLCDGQDLLRIFARWP